MLHVYWNLQSQHRHGIPEIVQFLQQFYNQRKQNLWEHHY